MIIKTYDQFKKTFATLFKKYHPDNKETGDAQKFIQYRNQYNDIIKSGKADKLKQKPKFRTPEVMFNIFDIMLGKTIRANVLGKDMVIKIKPGYLLKHRKVVLTVDKKRLTIYFKYDKIHLTKEDIEILEKMSKKYGNG